MLINELSKKTGLSVHTIRFYEHKGLIQGLTDENVRTNNYKQYDENHVERLEVITEAQEAGFTLAEIRVLLERWYSGKFSKEEQLEFFDSKIAEVENKILQLQQAMTRLQEVRKSIEEGECLATP